MMILSGLFRSRDKPKNSTSGSAYRFFFGGSTSGKNVNERSAMQMTAVYACVRILSESIAGLPVHLYQYRENGSKEKAIDHPLYRILHDEPNPEMTSFVFRETLMTHLLLWGNAYSQIIRNEKGEIVALYPLMPDRMTVDRDEHGRLYYEYLVYDGDDVDGRTGTDPKANGKIVRLHPADVLHIPGLGFDGLVGYSPIAMAKNAIGLAIAAEEYGSKFYANGAAPSGVLEHPGTLKDPGRVRESWQSTFGGSSNANKVAVLEEGMKYTPISIAPNEAQFLETRKFQINEIARIFRVPPHMVGDLDKSSFSNIEQQSLEFVKYTLDPWVIRWEQALKKSLFLPEPPDQEGSFYVLPLRQESDFLSFLPVSRQKDLRLMKYLCLHFLNFRTLSAAELPPDCSGLLHSFLNHNFLGICFPLPALRPSLHLPRDPFFPEIFVSVSEHPDCQGYLSCMKQPVCKTLLRFHL